jgi:hypothetical protein
MEIVKWRAANDGAGKRRYFVCKPEGRCYLKGKNGQLIRFVSREAARARADALNKAESEEEKASGTLRSVGVRTSGSRHG